MEACPGEEEARRMSFRRETRSRCFTTAGRSSYRTAASAHSEESEEWLALFGMREQGAELLEGLLADRALGTARRPWAENVSGTPAHMAPEQVRGREVNGRADLYVLGCVLYPSRARHQLRRQALSAGGGVAKLIVSPWRRRGGTSSRPSRLDP